MVTKPRGSSGSSLETQMSWISLGNKYCVSVYTCFLTYDNMNADRTANEQLLHKSHCVPLPCPPHLHPVTQHRWEANILTNATLKINVKKYISSPEVPHLSGKAHKAEEHSHRAPSDTRGTLEYSPQSPDPHIVPVTHDIITRQMWLMNQHTDPANVLYLTNITPFQDCQGSWIRMLASLGSIIKKYPTVAHSC